MTWSCPACLHANEPEFDYCERCGTTPTGEVDPQFAAADAAEDSDGVRCDPSEAPVLCPHCLTGNAPDAHFCAKCNTPLTSHAATDPMGQILSAGDTYRKAVDAPRSVLLMLGMCLIFVPTLVAGLFAAKDGYFIEYLLVLLAVAILWKLTRNYLSWRRAQRPV